MFVQQKGKHDCGIACLAMAAYMSYEEAAKYVPFDPEETTNNGLPFGMGLAELDVMYQALTGETSTHLTTERMIRLQAPPEMNDRISRGVMLSEVEGKQVLMNANCNAIVAIDGGGISDDVFLHMCFWTRQGVLYDPYLNDTRNVIETKAYDYLFLDTSRQKALGDRACRLPQALLTVLQHKLNWHGED